jgi:GNAT superfamily N-acetyltransferase
MEPTMPYPHGGHILRRAEVADADGVADVWLRSFDAALPTVRRAHSDEDVRGWIRHELIPAQETWVAEADGDIVGMMALHGRWLEQLYLRPSWHGRGVGDSFVEMAKTRRPDGLELWTFQVNEPARRFYERHGFVPVEYTDGAGNEEREPDIRYVWPAKTAS